MVSKRRCCGLRSTEPLESRNLLAGDVMVAVVDGNIVVNGDAASNHIVMTANQVSGELVIEGHPSAGEMTTINGQNGPFVIDSLDRSIRMRMGRGADVVDVPAGTFGGSLFIGTGLGVDHVRIGSEMSDVVVIAGSLGVRTGPGADFVVETGLDILGNHSIGTGFGADHVFMGLADPANSDQRVIVGGHLQVNLGRGADVLVARGVASDVAAFYAGAGDDVISLHGLRSSRLGIHTGPGDDSVDLFAVQAPAASVAMGLGNDRLSVVDSAFARFTSHLGDGNDIARFSNTSVSHAALLSGGGGRDRLVSLGGNRFGHLVIAQFESVHGLDDDGDQVV
jgi:hypothetical protein